MGRRCEIWTNELYQCAKCKELKPAIAFFNSKKVNKTSFCRACKIPYSKKYPHRFSAMTRCRYLKRRQRLPKWITSADLQHIAKLYELASQLTKSTGVCHEVDHIIPINGKYVSGLHVLSNLRVVTRSQNRKKGNKW